ncbi:uncharacterized protein SPSK_08077 [Sporothrix schenckii 1099-18]|uniref:Uncharacterized protein n=1 Tax=Sporothrix schenckii 1099-18 TaxID=1397361 RepID=A0A0F2MKM0_SPOSC|nr:uncharacterized protein SPSK_08077 [Sporothrix schenckii 1099-18]KJR88736.1 hypothetical protein SPSK_08077 [Sporothrix schenckii 1099-18]
MVPQIRKAQKKGKEPPGYDGRSLSKPLPFYSLEPPHVHNALILPGPDAPVEGNKKMRRGMEHRNETRKPVHPAPSWPPVLPRLAWAEPSIAQSPSPTAKSSVRSPETNTENGQTGPDQGPKLEHICTARNGCLHIRHGLISTTQYNILHAGG